MRVLLFIPRTETRNKEIQGIVASIHTGTEIESYTTVEGVSERLCTIGEQFDLAVLFVSSVALLRQIVELDRALVDISVVLVVPDSAPETMALAHRLRPRYVAVFDRMGRSLSLVLENIARHNGFAF